MGYLAESIDDFDLINGMYRWRKAAVHAEYLIVDDDAQGKKIEHIGKVVPDISIAILSCTLGVKSVGLSNAARLVVAANEMNAMGVS